MQEPDISLLLLLLGVLIFLSACFSASETAMMSINRYRLRHLANSGNRGAIIVSKMLKRPDRLIGLILLGNNFVNILASSITTLIVLELNLDHIWVAVAAGILTFVILIFAEVAPKTTAIIYPEKIAFPASFVLKPLSIVCLPLVWFINLLSNGLLKIFGISPKEGAMQQLSREELRTVVNEAGAMIPHKHQKMLINILDLEKVTVDDIIIPRNEIVGINFASSVTDIIDLLINSQHTRLPIFEESMNNVIGILHVRDALALLAEDGFNHVALRNILIKPYFVPEGTPLHIQLLNFQEKKLRTGFVVNEYGDIEGLVALDDILEEIVGEFTTDAASSIKDVISQEDGSFLVDGSTNIRQLNRLMQWMLPIKGPKTINGLILETLESIPSIGTTLLIKNHPIEIIQTTDNGVKVVKISPALKDKTLET